MDVSLLSNLPSPIQSEDGTPTLSFNRVPQTISPALGTFSVQQTRGTGNGTGNGSGTGNGTGNENENGSDENGRNSVSKSQSPSIRRSDDFLVGVDESSDSMATKTSPQVSRRTSRASAPRVSVSSFPSLPGIVNVPMQPTVTRRGSEEGLYISDECVVLPFWREQIVCNGEVLVSIPYATDDGQPIVMNQPNATVIESSDTSAIVSFIVDIHFEVEGNQLDGSVKICVKPDPNLSSTNDICLGFLDESLDPPEWKCEEICLKKEKGGLLCGFTSHFTNFALLLGASHAGLSSDKCEAAIEVYVTGSVENDMILIASCAGGMVFFFFLFWFLADNCKLISKFVYGEGYRIRRLRFNSTQKFLEKEGNRYRFSLADTPSTSALSLNDPDVVTSSNGGIGEILI